MIVRILSTLTRDAFLERHPVPHVIVGHLDQEEAIPGDEFMRDEPGCYSSLAWAVASLELSGDYAVRMLEDWSTVWLAFARSEDAEKVRGLVGALPEVAVTGECQSSATFVFDRLLHDRLCAIRDRRVASIEGARLRGEEVTYLQADGAPSDPDDIDEADYGGFQIEGGFPLGPADS